MNEVSIAENEIREIPLTRGQVALVDADVYEVVSQFKWTITPRYTGFYAYRQAPRGGSRKVTQYMHRFIMAHYLGHELKRNEFVDHIDDNGLNNCRDNIRICTPSQNLANLRSRKGSSIYKGVSLFKASGKWKASICKHRKQIHLGFFTDEADAARAYDAAAKELFGEFALPNFPEAQR